MTRRSYQSAYPHRIKFDAYRQRSKEHGSAWTIFLRLGLAFVEVNLGTDKPRSVQGITPAWACDPTSPNPDERCLVHGGTQRGPVERHPYR